MTYDDYEQMRNMYADVDGLCRDVEEAGTTLAPDESLHRLVRLFQDQQREPEQIRSFVRHLGVPDDVIARVLGQAPTSDDAKDDLGIA